MNIYVARDGQTYGPYPPDQAHALIGEGQLLAEDLACPEGASEWNPLGQLLGLSPAETPTSQPLATNRDGIPLAQPASAVHPPGYHPFDEPGADVEPPRSPAAKHALGLLEKKVAAAKTKAGLAAALAIIALGLPALAFAAGSGASGGLAGFLGGTLGVLWSSVIGVVLAAPCCWWFRSAQKRAMVANCQLRGGPQGRLAVIPRTKTNPSFATWNRLLERSRSGLNTAEI